MNNSVQILTFLKNLDENNTREWMQDNKKAYEEAKGAFLEIIAQVSETISQFDPSLANLDPKKAMYRLARDVRFSKDKTPYKTHFGALLSAEGKKSEKPFYYLHVRPDHSMLGAGLYCPPSPILKKVRQEIDYNGDKLVEILKSKPIQKNFGGLADMPDQKLKTAPKGYPKDHKHIDLLRNKSFILKYEVSDDLFSSADFIKKTAPIFKSMKPFNDWFAVVFEEENV